jgi:uncharacterized membrane protein
MQIKANDRAGMIPGIIVGASVAAMALSARWLPAQVSWHFDFSGAPNAFVSRGVYLTLMMALAVAAAVSVRFGLLAWVRGKTDALPIPNRSYQLAPERRDATLAYVVRQTAWIAATFAVFVLLAYLFNIRCNRLTPPHQAPEELVCLMAGMLVVCLLWVARIAWHFRRPGQARQPGT